MRFLSSLTRRLLVVLASVLLIFFPPLVLGVVVAAAGGPTGACVFLGLVLLIITFATLVATVQEFDL